MSELREFLEYEDAGRGRVDAVGLELLFDSFYCHFLRFSDAKMEKSAEK